MAGLYERLIGYDDLGERTAGHRRTGMHGMEVFLAILSERARGTFATNAAARDALNAVLAARGKDILSAEDEADALALLTLIAGQANATAKLAKAMEINDVLQLAAARVDGYTTPALVKTRLGV